MIIPEFGFLTNLIAVVIMGGICVYVWFLISAWFHGVGVALRTMFNSPSPSKVKEKSFPDKTPKKDPIKPAERRPKHLIPVKEALTSISMSMDEFEMHVGSGAIQTYLHDGEMYVNPKHLEKLKRSYPVITSFDEEHRISNPVEFTT